MIRIVAGVSDGLSLMGLSFEQLSPFIRLACAPPFQWHCPDVTCGSAKPRAMSSFSMSACPPHNSGAHLWALLIDGPRKRLCGRQWISTDVKVAVPGTDHGMRRSEELAVIRAVEECCNCKEIVSHKAF